MQVCEIPPPDGLAIDRRVQFSPCALWLLAMLAACAPPVWEHSTKGLATFEQDREECAQQAAEAEMSIDPHGGGSIPLNERVRLCLQARGYTERHR